LVAVTMISSTVEAALAAAASGLRQGWPRHGQGQQRRADEMHLLHVILPGTCSCRLSARARTCRSARDGARRLGDLIRLSGTAAMSRDASPSGEGADTVLRGVRGHLGFPLGSRRLFRRFVSLGRF
jgi:hypothetical protein